MASKSPLEEIKVFYRFTVFGIIGTLLTLSWPGTPASYAQTCSPLKVIGGQGTQAQKTISPPGTPVSRNNWNTDFAVPSGIRFTRYIATVIPGSTAEYNVQVYLKYSNNTDDKIYDQDIALTQNKPLRVSGAPRADSSPYQVNVRIGGIDKVGRSYIASVVACR
jgi:hypothetical protein